MRSTIVPTLLLIAAASGASAADLAARGAAGEQAWLKPELRFGGAIEVIADVGTDSAADNPTTSANEHRWYGDFGGLADVSVDVRLNDQVGARADLWAVPQFQGDSTLDLRDAYLSLSQGEWSAKLGKTIRPLGLLSPHQDQLASVFESTIGYTGAGGPYGGDAGIFGNDTLGAQVSWHARDLPLSVTGMLNNGFWGSEDAGSGSRPTSGRERNDLGYGVDASYSPNQQVTIDGQVAYEPHSSIGFATTYPYGITHGGTRRNPTAVAGYDHPAIDQVGPALFLDLNATVRPDAVKPLTLAAEIVRFAVGDGSNAGTRVSDSGYERWQGLVLANWAFERAPFPTSVTGMIQHIQDKSDVDDTHGRAWEVSASLLTQPFPRTRLHLDAEVAYQTVDSQQSQNAHGVELAGRALLNF